MDKPVCHRLRGETLEITYTLFAVGADLVLVVEGGRAHIGSVVLAAPRESLRGDGTPSATSSVLNLPAHKDEVLLRPLAERLSALSGRAACALGGVHLEPFDEDALREVTALNGRAMEEAPRWLEELI